jgi:hypothetical protein
MRKLIILLALNVICFGTFGQKAFKEITVDLRERKIDSILPIEQSFYLNLISDAFFTLNDYRLLRVRIRKSYIPFASKRVLYYLDIPLTNASAPTSKRISTKASKVTITSSERNRTDTVQERISTTVSEYLLSPEFNQIKYISRVYIEPLTPNFYYYLIRVDTSEALGIDHDTLSKNNLNLFNAIESNTTIPLGNTALDASENLNRHITATCYECT